MASPFTSSELEILSGKYPTVAKKHGVSSKYVKYIADGDRDVKSEKAKEILKTLTDLIELLTPSTEPQLNV